MAKAKIRGRDHEPVTRRLIAAGWTSTAIALYVRTRFAVDLHDSTVRVYRLKEKEQIELEYPDLVGASAQKTFADKHIVQDSPVDTIGSLEELIRMQRERIELDLRHEVSMGKLFTTTKSEIKLLADLLAQYHETLQDWGVVPKAGLEISVDVKSMVYQPQQVMAVTQVLEGDELESAIAFSRLIGEKAKALPPSVSPNGQSD